MVAGRIVFRVMRPLLRSSSPKYFNKNCIFFNTKKFYGLSKNIGLPGTILHCVPIRKKTILRDNKETDMGVLSPLDPSSYSRPELAILKHVSLKLSVKFDEKVLQGSALLKFDVLKDIDQVLLDVSNLTIGTVELEDGTPLQFEISGLVENFGSKLTIKLPSTISAGNKLNIRISYTSSPTASALQWLDPPQTSGKKHPYMFSQCQPIHARSIVPCQDTPYVKFTYDAEIVAPDEFTVLMSALRNEKTERTAEGIKTIFNQPTPTPAYLIAIAVGVLESRRLGPRSLVWSEKEEIELSAWEFAETEKYLQAAEKLCGPYEWKQYDLLVLPPSFPYGGMENPCLTFVTPTLLAGDRSQADVIVHEIMHSWTGNLVTNRNFEHFWLNEGFTVFLERKVAASLIDDAEESKRARDFNSLLGLQELKETVNVLGATNPLSRLVLELNGVHPDDSFSRVPYEKGSLFLRYIEDLVGGPGVFDDFMRSYLNQFKFKSLDTDEFKSYLLNYFKDNKELKNLDWNAWLHTSGMPPAIPNYDTTLSQACTDLANFVTKENPSAFKYDDVKSFSPHQLIHFLQQIIDAKPLPLEKVRAMGEVYKLNDNKNTEIIYRWLRICLKSKDETKLDEAFSFVNRQGRMKYVRPIYRDLYAWEDVRDAAIENFLKNEPNMMHVSAYTVRKDLHLN